MAGKLKPLDVEREDKPGKYADAIRRGHHDELQQGLLVELIAHFGKHLFMSLSLSGFSRGPFEGVTLAHGDGVALVTIFFLEERPSFP
jgi:hypothetical protein